MDFEEALQLASEAIRSVIVDLLPEQEEDWRSLRPGSTFTGQVWLGVVNRILRAFKDLDDRLTSVTMSSDRALAYLNRPLDDLAAELAFVAGHA